MKLDKALQEFALKELNDQTGDNVFVGGYLFYNDPQGNLQIVQQIENTYTEATIDIVGVSVLNYIGEQQPIPNIKKITYTMPFQLLVEVDKLDDVIDAINGFQDKYRGKRSIITVDSIDFNTIFNFTPIDRGGGLQQHGGKLLQTISFTMFTNSTDKILDSGNDVIVKVNDVQLPILSYTAAQSATSDDFLGFVDKLSTASKIGATWTASVNTYLDLSQAIHKQIRDDLYDGEDRTYTLKVTLPTATATEVITKAVFINNFSAPYTLGDFTVYTLVFKEV